MSFLLRLCTYFHSNDKQLEHTYYKYKLQVVVITLPDVPLFGAVVNGDEPNEILGLTQDDQVVAVVHAGRRPLAVLLDQLPVVIVNAAVGRAVVDEL